MDSVMLIKLSTRAEIEERLVYITDAALRAYVRKHLLKLAEQSFTAQNVADQVFVLIERYAMGATITSYRAMTRTHAASVIRVIVTDEEQGAEVYRRFELKSEPPMSSMTGEEPRSARPDKKRREPHGNG